MRAARFQTLPATPVSGNFPNAPKPLAASPGLQTQANEIFILGDDHTAVFPGVIPDDLVPRFIHAEIENVFGLVAAQNQKANQRLRKLVVHEKGHTV